MEENVASGGFGEKVRTCLDEARADANVLQIAIPDEFVTHGKPEILMQQLRLDAASVADRILDIL